MNVEQIGLQLYTVRERAKADFVGTLREVAEAGYRAVEFAGFHGLTVPQLRSALDEYGLRAVAAHVPIADFESRPERLFAELQALGCEHAIVPWLPEERRGSAEETQRLAEAFNRWGELCRGWGLRFGYHNHDFEFAPLDGTTMLDLLIEETDPALVHFQIDIGWVEYVGVDAVSLIRRLAGRVPLVHVKDLAPDGDGADVPVGQGTIRWEPVLAAAAAADTEWYIIEQDKPQDVLADIQASLRALQGMAVPST